MLLSEEFKKRMAKLAGVKPQPAEEVISELKAEDVSIPDEYVHDTLNPAIWQGDELIPSVKDRLIRIAVEFYNSLEIKQKPVDIKIVGSNANYNWSPSSDIDLHLYFDISSINQDRDLAKKYLDAKKELWKSAHHIKIKGFDVELYSQDVNEPLTSGGIYSLYDDNWETKPDKTKPEIDRAAVKAKSAYIASQIENLISFKGSPEEKYAKSQEIKTKIKKMRQCGLDKSGEYSIENLAFKYLRNEGYLEQLRNISNKSYDAMLSSK